MLGRHFFSVVSTLARVQKPHLQEDKVLVHVGRTMARVKVPVPSTQYPCGVLYDCLYRGTWCKQVSPTVVLQLQNLHVPLGGAQHGPVSAAILTNVSGLSQINTEASGSGMCD